MGEYSESTLVHFVDDLILIVIVVFYWDFMFSQFSCVFVIGKDNQKELYYLYFYN